MKLRLLLIALFIPLFCILGLLKSYNHQPKFLLDKHCEGYGCLLIKSLAHELNEVNVHTNDRYMLYATNFDEHNLVSSDEDQSLKKIIYIGSTSGFSVAELYRFDIILASSPELTDFLNRQKLKAYYFPLFAPYEAKISPVDKRDVLAVIGNPPFIEEILREKKLAYQKYDLHDADKILHDMPNFRAAFAENTALNSVSLDLHPVFLQLAFNKIPLVTCWGWPDVVETINLFNDTINFYMFQSDAQDIIEKILKDDYDPIIVASINKALKFVEKRFSPKAASLRLKYILEHKKEPPELLHPFYSNNLFAYFSKKELRFRLANLSFYPLVKNFSKKDIKSILSEFVHTYKIKSAFKKNPFCFSFYKKRGMDVSKLLFAQFKLPYLLKKYSDYLVFEFSYPYFIDHTLNVDIQAAVGHVSSGDYWLAHDLNDSLNKLDNWETDITFFNTIHKYPTEVNIIWRGEIPYPKHALVGNINILYLGFAAEEILDNTEHYINIIRDLAIKKEIDAFAISSKKLINKLKERGINAYYVPQFTNPDKFYPDYTEELKSEVLFVGNNLFYRKAAPAVLKAGLPITIYGPQWEGLAKAEYIDNRVLRKYYSSAKIVLSDARDGMKNYGFIINRIFDATACETLVISDYMKEIEEIYGDSIPMWKTEDELIELVKYYLDPEHEEERLAKAKRAREITLKNFTSDKAAQKFQTIINDIKQKKGLR